MRTGSVCTGYGGLDLAVHEVLGGELAWAADIDPGASAILAHRFPSVPNLGDISKTDWSAVEPVDVLTAGFPCQDVSCAGGRAGLREGNRTGVWAYVARAIDELRPSLVVLENVRGLLSAGADSDLESCPWCVGEAGNEHPLRALGAVLGDLADLGYDARWAVVSAADAGAPHRRERVFITAHPAAEPAGVRLPLRQPEHLGRGSRAAAAQGGRNTAEHYGVLDQGSAAAEDADRAASGERRQSAPGQAPGWRPRADAGRPGRAPVAADAAMRRRDDRIQHAVEPGSAGAGVSAAGDAGGGDLAPAYADRQDAGPDTRGSGGEAPAGTGNGQERRREPGPGISRGTPADADRQGWQGAESAPGRDVPARRAAADADGSGRRLDGRRERQGREGQQLGLRPAEHQPGNIAWGNYAPAIRRWEAVLGRPAPRPTEPGRTGERLSPRFVEWLMGLPEGWVTDVPGLSRNAQLKALGNGVVPAQAAMALRLLLERSGLLPLVAADLTSAEGGEAA